MNTYPLFFMLANSIQKKLMLESKKSKCITNQKIFFSRNILIMDMYRIDFSIFFIYMEILFPHIFVVESESINTTALFNIFFKLNFLS